MAGVGGVGGSKGASGPAKASEKGKTGAFKAVKDAGGAGPAGKVTRSSGGGEADAPARPAAFKVANQEALRAAEGVEATGMHPDVAEFAQGMVQAADAAAMPGPTTDGDLLPRESVSGLFVRDFALQGAVALGRAPLGEDEAARIVIEKHIDGQAGLYFDANVKSDGDAAYIVSLHRLDTNPPFLPAAEAEATYKIDRKTWAVEQAEQ